MSINIKNPETTRLIRELAELTGQGQTEAGTEAVKGRIAQVRQKKGYGRYEPIMAIARETGPLLKGVPDLDDFLYDPETGLPR